MWKRDGSVSPWKVQHRWSPSLRMKKTLWGRLLRLGHSGHPFQALSLYQALEEGSPFPMLSLLGWSQMKSNY